MVGGWYCPVSTSAIELSVALIDVDTCACLASFAGVAHVVFQPRAPPEWPGARQARHLLPALAGRERAPGAAHRELAGSRLPDRDRASAPAPCGAGFGPHASPHSLTVHCSERPLALHEPLSVGWSSAARRRGV